MDQRISIGFSCAVLAIVTAQGCIESSCEEKRTCGGSPAPVEAAGIGGNLGLLPRATGGRAGSVGFGEGGKDDATDGAVAEAGSGGDAAEPAMGGGGSGGEPSTPAGGEPGVEADACTPSPCAHGTCAPLGASFECACDAGYSGDLCDKNIDDCTPNPCQNGGRCDDGVGAYSCVCDGRFTGDECELPRFEIIQPSFEAEAMAISGDGRVVVGGIYTRPSFERSVGFSWTGGTLEIVEPGAAYTDSWLSYVNHDGTIRFGYLYADGAALSARWDDGGPTLLTAGGERTALYGCSPEGSVAVGYLGSSSKAVAWTGGSATVLDVDADQAWATAASSDGRVIVGSLLRSGTRMGFRWTNGELEVLSTMSGAESCAPEGISADGQIIQGTCIFTTQILAVVWEDGTIRDLGTPAVQRLQGTWITVEALSRTGNAIVGMASDFNLAQLPLIWTKEDGMRWFDALLEEQGIDLSGYSWDHIARLRDIANDGKTVVGTVLTSDGSYRAFIARLP